MAGERVGSHPIAAFDASLILCRSRRNSPRHRERRIRRRSIHTRQIRRFVRARRRFCLALNRCRAASLDPGICVCGWGARFDVQRVAGIRGQASECVVRVSEDVRRLLFVVLASHVHIEVLRGPSRVPGQPDLGARDVRTGRAGGRGPAGDAGPVLGDVVQEGQHADEIAGGGQQARSIVVGDRRGDPGPARCGSGRRYLGLRGASLIELYLAAISLRVRHRVPAVDDRIMRRRTGDSAPSRRGQHVSAAFDLAVLRGKVARIGLHLEVVHPRTHKAGELIGRGRGGHGLQLLFCVGLQNRHEPPLDGVARGALYRVPLDL